MRDIVRHLKKFVSEQAFFCFLTDRSYFEYLTQRTATQAYPIEHTYFTDRLFVVFRPENLHDYVCAHLRLEESPAADSSAAADEERRIATSDLAALPYVILQRAEMHPIDLQREIGDVRGRDGEMAIPPGALRSELRGRCDVMVQLAVRMLLNRKDLRILLEREPEVTRLAYDAVYYPNRMRRLGKFDLDLSDAGRADFERYLAGRMVPDLLDQQDYHDVTLSTTDIAFFYGLVREMAALISDPYAYQDALATWEAETGTELDSGLREALPLTLGTGPLLALVGRHRYRWGYDHLGRAVGEQGRGALAYQFDLKIRLAIQMVLQDLRGDPDYERLRDILWLPYLLWREGGTVASLNGTELNELVADRLPAEYGQSQRLAQGSQKLYELYDVLAAPDTFTTRVAAEGWASAYPLVVQSFKDHSPLLVRQEGVYRWAFGFDGTRLMAGAHAPPLAEEEPWEVQAAFIRGVNADVKQLTDNAVDLARLAGPLRVIGASPEWVAVERALTLLKNAGKFRRPAPAAEVNVVRAYTALLEQSGEVIALALACGTAAGAATTQEHEGSGAMPRPPVELGLEAIAALALDGSRPVVEVLRSLRAEAARRPPAGPGVPLGADDPPGLSPATRAAWKGWVAARRSALFSGFSPDLAKVRERAWGTWLQRFRDGATPAGGFAATMDEVLCRAAGVSPATLLPPRLSTLSLDDWTTVLLRALMDEDPAAPSGVPGWMAIPALGALGLGAQARRVIPLLLGDPVTAYEKRPHDAERAGAHALLPDSSALPVHPPERSFLVLRRTAPARPWPVGETPAGAALALTVADLRGFVASAPAAAVQALLSGFGNVVYDADDYEEVKKETHEILALHAPGLLKGARSGEPELLRQAQTERSPLDRLVSLLAPPDPSTSLYAQIAAANGEILPPRLAAFLGKSERAAGGPVHVAMGRGMVPALTRRLLDLWVQDGPFIGVYRGQASSGPLGPGDRFQAVLNRPKELRGDHYADGGRLVHVGRQAQVTFAMTSSLTRVVLRQQTLETKLEGFRGWWLRNPVLGPRFDVEIVEQADHGWVAEVRVSLLFAVRLRIVMTVEELTSD
jgi:hypothetical protein